MSFRPNHFFITRLCLWIAFFGLTQCQAPADNDVAECIPQCGDNTRCGILDGCGGTCECPDGFECDNSECIQTCDVTCQSGGFECGTLCGEVCGTCDPNEHCEDGQCVCTPVCGPESCGQNDGCGGVCECEDCGNGTLDPGELCDGNCPEDCNDDNACTVDSLTGEVADCNVQCSYATITSCIGDDGCCAPGCNSLSDNDCLPLCGNDLVEAGEACDGNCPEICDDELSCTTDSLSGSATDCSAVCVFSEITDCENSDDCCPNGCNHNNDNDCLPSCGNGVVETNELCDGDCPVTCDDSNSCTMDTLNGSSSTCNSTCSYLDVTSCTNDDGCCAPGCNSLNDNDCSPICQNNLVEAGELCDGNCDTTCNDNFACTEDSSSGSAATCDFKCFNDEILMCSDDDGCCPSGCDSITDNDCQSVCGNLLIELGELCDGDCPTTCENLNACTLGSLIGSSTTCSAECLYTEIITCTSGDGCCAEGCNNLNDDDCASLCSNNVVEPGETCDGNCPQTCDDALACTTDSLSGSAADCDATCLFIDITVCENDDGCCALGCNNNSDNDCSASCGNNIVEANEVCDGNCPTACDDSNSCTLDSLNGSANACNIVCSHIEITSCTSDDGCCSPGCNSLNDNDCTPICQNNLVEEGEYCDGNCETTCDDSFACTIDDSSGSAATCDLQCFNNEIFICFDDDGCCPLGCDSITDNDCQPFCGNSLLEMGEVCDGDCPTACAHQNSCTIDSLIGSSTTCSAECLYSEIITCTSGDGCCAQGCNNLNDDDCAPLCSNNVVEAGETCDGNCPQTCDDALSCTTDSLNGSTADCSAVCVFSTITICENDDGCCAAGCNNNNDDDCSASCGNSIVEENEVCDGNCPTVCDDANSCTVDTLNGSASTCNTTCGFIDVTICAHDDGCCAPGCNSLNDNDCAPVCQNNLVEAGETCDGNCATNCWDNNSCTLDDSTGSAATCTLQCINTPVLSCLDNDNCCPSNCDSTSDTDCLPICGNNVLELGEVCDGDCPTICEDQNACTIDNLVGSSTTCTAECFYTPIRTCTSGDACCAQGCNNLNDDDCAPLCSNNVVEAGETCDGNCPSTCDDGLVCTSDSLSGSAPDCSAVCIFSEITACENGDGCCAAGCNNNNDNDCSPSCGNNIVEASEVCDGNCPTTCDDTDSCTANTLSGLATTCNAVCSYIDVTNCANDDGCCAPGCNSLNDNECAPVCLNNLVEAGEVCDGNCATNCWDNNSCTLDNSTGSAATCDFQCSNTLILACADDDGCCAGGCDSLTDNDCQPICGNSILEGEEICDGDCPTSCEDQNACTIDNLTGSSGSCDSYCSYDAILTCTSGDGCCATGCNNLNDDDCAPYCSNNVVEAGETCDGNCPQACDDALACTTDSLNGSATDCSAVCVFSDITGCENGDGCCAPGCNNNSDDDCSASCGNNIVEANEVCDGNCPTACLDSNSCTVDSLNGSPETCNAVCSYIDVSSCTNDDGCCAPGCNSLNDNNCAPICLNNLVEAGEICDGNCETSCDDSLACTIDTSSGSAITCDFRCFYDEILLCSNDDACCPLGCDSITDNDCQPVCGNSLLELGEICDGDCPTTCEDQNTCTVDTLIGSSSTCSAECLFTEILTCNSSDGCCAPGCNNLNDDDCAPLCSNNVVEAGETCDGNCPQACDDALACTTDSLSGSATDCNAVCVFSDITGCENSDGCCPTGCNNNNDNDCSASCGNDIVEANEVCDGNCPAACDDSNGCTIDSLNGSATACNALCSYIDITNCANDDGCCPPGCNSLNDNDCAPVCPNNLVEAGEICDGDCETSCDDSLACTVDTSSGSAATCDFQCINDEILSCSNDDACCPLGCDSFTDNDCQPICGNSLLELGELCDGDCPTNCEDQNACTIDTLIGSPNTCDADCSSTDILTCTSGDGCCATGCNNLNDDDCAPLCSNNVVEAGETCDGNCPQACDDTLACTTDTLNGSATDCSAVCVFSDITSCKNSDGCCPAGCNNNNDNDCSASCGNDIIETNEDCDGNCPTECNDSNSCTLDSLNGSATTCNAVCNYIDITNCTNDDGCCAPGCNSLNDNDCTPVCLNNLVEAGEICDGNCETSCDDNNTCTVDSSTGTASTCDFQCSNSLILACTDDDGCCAGGCDSLTDTDCQPICGNSLLEVGEVCDGDCPSECNAPNACTITTLLGSSTSCSAQCTSTDINTCTSGDGCCASGCNNLDDTDCAPICSNNVVETGETCDGNCPTTCNDGLSCTTDSQTGNAANCDIACVFSPITTCENGDGCCPSGCNSNNDDDCSPNCGNSVIEANELCDSNCPTACNDSNTCTTDSLNGSASSCDALCSYIPITSCTGNDGCCAPGCNSLNDNDCAPVCLNNLVEAGEVCDGNCPTTCSDNNACTVDTNTGSSETCNLECSNTLMVFCVDSDGCCPDTCTSLTDNDCSISCGNNVTEATETCDGDCPAQCNAPNTCTTAELLGSPSNCTAQCSYTNITACNSGDGCCPTGCTSLDDNDCVPLCSNNVVEAGETCDGNCPNSCDDGLVCTSDSLSGTSANCDAICGFTNITNCVNGDGCCPSGCHNNNDADCNPSCGNSVLEGNEICDGDCPTACDDSNVCTVDTLNGSATACNAFCTNIDIRACSNGDGCCAPGCNSLNDDDCAPVCSNNLVEEGESCDGNCGASCWDNNTCTIDASTGSAATCDFQCTNTPVLACLDDDNCCPNGCDSISDTDCQPFCGNSIPEAGEICDGDCPTNCEDQNACTIDALVGSSANCSADCSHIVIFACTSGDGCCAQGCNNLNDDDCAPLCSNNVVEPGEICDGNCPTTCDDGLACTSDALNGSSANCDVACGFTDIIACTNGDGCCPTGCHNNNDNDCSPSCGNSVLETNEICDGNCPVSCNDSNGCTTDSLSGSAPACDAFCSNVAITSCIHSDGCCAPGCNSLNDNDCDPICQNNLVEEGESCDGNCGTSCWDNNTCTMDNSTGSSATCDFKCVNTPLLACTNGDSCCPNGCDSISDSDCQPVCGNTILEAGEVCDGDCPTSCEDQNTCTTNTLLGSSTTCSATCSYPAIVTCISGDSCCAPGCNSLNDDDCAPLCSNNVVEAGEICDGNCPTTCNDGLDCTADTLSGSSESCNAACGYTDITACTNADGCCPSGCHNNNDGDCAPSCGNSVIETNETCDGNCPTACDDSNTCTTDSLNGSANACDAFCTNVDISSCIHSDGCCAPGCNSLNDNDCAPICQNNLVEAGETCDGNCETSCEDSIACTDDTSAGSAATCDFQCFNTLILSCTDEDGCCPNGCDSLLDNDCQSVCGNLLLEAGESCDGDCPTSCEDQNTCTIDSLVGSSSTCNAECSNTAISACISGDGCCAAGCNSLNDGDCAPICSNNFVEAGETCDGNCPTTCNDGLVCTSDSLTGSSENCNAACGFTDITACTNADGCCPSGCHNNNDGDCAPSCGNSVIEINETCDGNCPTACDDSNSCTTDSLNGSANACDAFCTNVDITSCIHSDGCCAPGCNSLNDNGCAPICQNNLVEAGELCDGNCETSCEDNDACTDDTSAGSAATCDFQCFNTLILACTDEDGCCPNGCNSLLDSDCQPVCGNLLVEAGESCDGDCPTSCEDQNVCTTNTLSGSSITCSATCSYPAIVTCISADGCCAPGCNNLNDDDCASVCSNNVVEAGETCDGNCPTTCDDGLVCTSDSLSGSSGSCNAVCSFTNISTCSNGDGCCPSGCHNNNDGDCSPNCGNSVIEGNEICDGNCPTACNDSNVCTVDSFNGSATTCDAFCTNVDITTCTNSDGCCAPGCNSLNDNDCAPICQNNLVEAGELCDGNCETSCEDNNPCTVDASTGSATTCDFLCSNTAIVNCLDSDACCPGGCNSLSDNDCLPGCGNNLLEAGEVCDGDCPTTCEDQNACTTNLLSGSSTTCNAACSYPDIVICNSGDSCCAPGCNNLNDDDCTPLCSNNVVEAGELCDGNCPTTCNDGLDCTADTLSGSSESCNATCGFTDITACTNGDGCCPSGCTNNNDTDCSPSCGNSVIEANEVCDGNCPTACDDSNNCTTDSLNGSAIACDAFCTNVDVTSCSDSDGCCAPGCNSLNDDDCAAICQNNLVEAGEICDGNCETSCDDSIACTDDTSSGSATTCDFQCFNTLILSCADEDGCCPVGCDSLIDNDCQPVCGNSLLEAGELCDSDCPTNCEDQNVCTVDALVGASSTCDADCDHTAISACTSADGCCAPGCNNLNDDDCAPVCSNNVVEAGETCDGNCPSICDDGVVCTSDSLSGSSENCDAACVFTNITACGNGDGCCPSGCNNNNDGDCASICGNNVVEANESCDGNCPTTCDDSNPCTTDSLNGSANGCDAFCSNINVTSCTNDDGCCAPGCNSLNDNGCTPVCPNNLVEAGELCDGNCPATCSDSNYCTMDSSTGTASSCDLLCINTPVLSCFDDDSCCPSGCDSISDTDCQPVCGNNLLELGEVCDGDCPSTCTPTDSCTTAQLLGSSTNCSAQCSYSPITACNSDDGCCPGGCNNLNDNDCAAVCGNNIVEAGELCDGNCPTSCDDTVACTADSLTGSTQSCDVACTNLEIVSCADGDGCCVPGCTNIDDFDCSPICGNGVTENGELCDGDCPTSCNDGFICTSDTLLGDASNCNASCVFLNNLSCSTGDGCCPEGCDSLNDADCPVVCGNEILEAGEICDGDCPTSCDSLIPHAGNDSLTVLLLNADTAGNPGVNSAVGGNTNLSSGAATTSGAQSVFGSGSISFDGSDDYLMAADNDDWSFGDEDFTIDLWARFNTASGYRTLITHSQSSGTYRYEWRLSYSYGDFVFQYSTTGTSYNGSATFSPESPLLGGQWYHLALVRSGTSLTLYIDGQISGSAHSIGNADFYNASARLYLGAYQAGSTLYQGDFNGYMDEVRISKMARWHDDSFTPPSQEYVLGDGSCTNIRLIGDADSCTAQCFCYVDTDNDGLSDETEANLGTLPNDADTDNDGANDGQEVGYGEDPLVANLEYVIINEFIALNDEGLQDEDGDSPDWIELYNAGNTPVDLLGWGLTDDEDNSDKWMFPDITLGAHDYLVVFASAKNRIPTNGDNLHTNFTLDASGKYLGLANAAKVLQPTSLFDPEYPRQIVDISYGRHSGEAGWQYFDTPTPGGPNEGGTTYDSFVADTQFSVDRGFYDSPFSLEVSTETNGATIRYTLDGTMPTTGYGTVYSGPIQIDGTSFVRAIAYKPGWLPTNVDTVTYIFIQDTINQLPNNSPPGPGWPNSGYAGDQVQVFDYAMDPDVVNDPDYSDLMDDALLAIPSISIVTNQDSLIHPNTGIYRNALQQGHAWERASSVELINPDGSKGFQVNAGLRIRGGASRRWWNPKHSFRLFFRDEYGDAKLKFPVFGDEGANEFDKLDLRTSQQYSWSQWWETGHLAVFNRDVFNRDTQRDMGQPYTRSRYYHLYLNGIYWGMFQSQERGEARYAATYYGGSKEDYDVIKVDSGPGHPYEAEATDGTLDAWYRIWDEAKAGLSSDDDYYRVQGLNTDGTPNPAYETLIDVDNLIDYMIVIFYGGNLDSPITWYGQDNFPNNFYVFYNRNAPSGFKSLIHDAEHTLLAAIVHGQFNELYRDRTGPFPGGNYQQYSNPQWVHQQLVAHPEYRLEFADHVHRHFFNGGLLTPEVADARFMTRANQIELAIIAESARWGDFLESYYPYAYLRTRNDHWQPAVDNIRNVYFPQRTGIVLDQLKNKGWYPSVDAPVFYLNGSYQHGGYVSAPYTINITNPNGSGSIYYTLDGSDPRLSFLEITNTMLITEDAAKSVLVPASDIGTDWRNAATFDDSTWTSGSGGVGYETSSPCPTGTSCYNDLFDIDLETEMFNNTTSCYIRIPFSIATDPADLDALTLRIRYDDGFVAYLNGVEVASGRAPAAPQWNSQATSYPDDAQAMNFAEFDISEALSALETGDNILAIHGLNFSTTSSDFLISAELSASESIAGTSSNGMPGTLTETTHVKARVFDNGEWSALNEATFVFPAITNTLRITEIMYRPQVADAEFIELQNVGSEPVNLLNTVFIEGIHFTFPSMTLNPGDYVLVVKNQAVFEAAYPSFSGTIAGEFIGSLDNTGERIRLDDSAGTTILSFRYNDAWYPITDGAGFSLTILDPTSEDTSGWDDKDGWRASTFVGGSPGEDDSGEVPDPGSIVINEVLAHSHAAAPDFIELHNTTDTSINIGGWFLSDSGTDFMKYEIAGGTSVPAGGYVVFYEDLHFGNPSDPGCNTPFALSENGEAVYLSSALSGELTGYREDEDFGASETGIAFGRYEKSTGAFNFVSLSSNTPGSTNTHPSVGPVVINEIMYNPASGNGAEEYIELHNITGSPIVLQRYYGDTNETVTWQFTDGIAFTFPIGTTIGPYDYLVVAKDPVSFAQAYTVPFGISVLGPYDGQLSNGGEKLEISMPGDVNAQGERQYIRVDRVTYDDQAPWPTGPDGSGSSLGRIVEYAYGNDVVNWEATSASPGE